ncbi:hypothetical protein BZA77DRAFT_105088 [Pyronema omphalodes]|nr:hypothetical protein BZA77DRAFT_105088 [Pyronema omphalodes]
MSKNAEEGIAGAFSHMRSGNNDNNAPRHGYATTPPPVSSHNFNPKTRKSISYNPYEDDDDDDGGGSFGGVSGGGSGSGVTIRFGGGGPSMSTGNPAIKLENSSEAAKAAKMERARHLTALCDWLTGNPKLMAMISIPENIVHINKQLIERFQELGGHFLPEDTKGNHMYAAVTAHVSTQKHLWPALSAEFEKRRVAKSKIKGESRPGSSSGQDAYPRGGYPHIGKEGGSWPGFGRDRGNDRERGRGNHRGGYGGDRGGYGGDRGGYGGDRGGYGGDREGYGGDRGSYKGDRGSYKGDRGGYSGDRGRGRGDRGRGRGRGWSKD